MTGVSPFLFVLLTARKDALNYSFWIFLSFLLAILTGTLIGTGFLTKFTLTVAGKEHRLVHVSNIHTS